MTMAHQGEHQPILNSSERNSSDLSEPRTNTNDRIILGENSAAEHEVPKKDTEEILAQATLSEFRDLDGWLALKVKSELVTQIYTNLGSEDEGINIADTQDVLSKELALEKLKNLKQAKSLEDMIPTVVMKQRSLRGGTDYSVKDIDNLQMRIHIHHEVVTLIDALESTGDEGLYNLAETYIKQTQLDAQNQVLNILNQQKAELVMSKVSDEEKIAELQDVIGSLENEIEHINGKVKERDDQIVDLDMNLLDNELVDHLTREAQDIAR